jgi:hypothetical protein
VNVNVFATSNPTATIVNKPPNPFNSSTPQPTNTNANTITSTPTPSSQFATNAVPIVSPAPSVDWRPTADEFETFKRYFHENKGEAGVVEREKV